MARRVKGVDKVLRNLNKVAKAVVEGAQRGVEDVALDLLGKAAFDAPVDQGDLRGSGYVDVGATRIAETDKQGNVMSMGRAGKTTEPVAKVGFGERYAYIQHENREFRHPRGGKAGYLMDNLRANEKRYKRHIEKKATEPLR